MKADRLASLERKHYDLHKRIEALEAERAPEEYIKPLKVEKLTVKTEIAELSNDLYSHGMTTPGNNLHDV